MIAGGRRGRGRRPARSRRDGARSRRRRGRARPAEPGWPPTHQPVSARSPDQRPVAARSAASTTFVSSMARVIGPTPPGWGARSRRPRRRPGRRRPPHGRCRPSATTRLTHVEHRGARLDHVGGDQRAHRRQPRRCRPGGPRRRGRGCRCGTAPPWRSRCDGSTHQAGRSAHRDAAAGEGDLGARDQHVVAAQQLDDRRVCTAAARACPAPAKRRLVGWSPSTSLAGSTAERIANSSRPVGCWTRKPVRCGSALSSATTAKDLLEGGAGGQVAADAGQADLGAVAVLAPAYQWLPGSSPSSTVPRPGTTPRSASAAALDFQLVLDGARTALPSRMRAVTFRILPRARIEA